MISSVLVNRCSRGGHAGSARGHRPGIGPLWGCGVQRIEDPRGAPGRRGSTSWGSASGGAANEDRTSWFVYTFIADRPVRSVKDNFRALTTGHRSAAPGAVLIRTRSDPARLVQLLPARRVQTHLQQLAQFTWWRIARLAEGVTPLEVEEFRRMFTGPNGRWIPLSADGINVRPRRGNGHPVSISGPTTLNPGPGPNQPDGRDRGEPGARKRARPVVCPAHDYVEAALGVRGCAWWAGFLLVTRST